MTFVLWELLIPLAIVFLLGLFFGWLSWGWRRTKISYSEWETTRQKAMRASGVEAEAELAELRSERDRLQAEIESQAQEAPDSPADSEVAAPSDTPEVAAESAVE